MAFCMEFSILLLSLHTSASQIIRQGSGPWLIHALKWAKMDSEFLESRGNFFYFYFFPYQGLLPERPDSLHSLKWGGASLSHIKDLTFDDFLFGVLSIRIQILYCLRVLHTYMHTLHIYSLSLSHTHTHTCTQTHTLILTELIQIPPRFLYAKLRSPLTEFALALYFFLVLLSLCNLSITYYSTHSVTCIFNYTLKIVSHTNSVFVMVDFVLFFTCLFVFNF